MEPHPIPQNVTSFQFHLIGDMTLKQFLYLAAGSSIAYFLFIFLSPIYPLITWPAIIISASLGAGFAFLPIASRPLDYWVLAFLKAIYSPTKMSWSKDKKSYKEHAVFQSRLVAYLSGLQPQPGITRNNPDSQSLRQPDAPGYSEPSQKPTTPQPELNTEELGKTVDLARQAQNIQLRIIQTERLLNQIKTEATQPTAIPVDYSQQVNKILTDLQGLIQQASLVKQQINIVSKTQHPIQIVPGAGILKDKVKVVTAQKSKQTQVALTTFPNVINGIVKDKLGNYLEGCIAVIHDKEGLPVRALKTNKLGQFTGSTPLPGGIYELALEKEGYSFDVLQIELKGEVLPPLLISAK